jgi:hypothetical protein
MEPDNKAGKIIVQNQSYDSTLEISDVWLKEPGSIDWVNYWHGSCKGDSEYINELSFNLDPGTYNVKIKVIKYGIFYRYYETGYMQPVIIKRDDSKFVIYDGNGIYDMEKYQ